ncbi:MAG: hypothetical protein NTY33_02805 [Candidatus Moranbacteria bacterium]|nr:hypothetical protein [Candidatus Moranbacteria bacterium]
MKMKLIKSLSLVNILSLIALLILPAIYFTPKAEAAANLNVAMVRIDNMTAGGTTIGTVCAKATSNPTNVAHVAIQFPSTWTVSATLSNWAVSTTNIGWPTGASAWPGILQATAADNGTKIVVFPSNSMVNTTTTYCFNWTTAAALTTNGTPANDQQGYLETQVTGGTAIDHSAIAFSTVASNTISVTGAVNPTFSFALPTNTDNFTTALTNGATATTTGSTATITTNTNARNGWTTWVKSANAALHSASPGATDITSPGTYDGTPTTLSAGTTGYVLKVVTSGGTSAPAAEYTAGADQGGTLTTAYNIAALETAPSNAETVTFTERARVATTQPPASDYTDTLTIVAAGMF